MDIFNPILYQNFLYSALICEKSWQVYLLRGFNGVKFKNNNYMIFNRLVFVLNSVYRAQNSCILRVASNNCNNCSCRMMAGIR